MSSFESAVSAYESNDFEKAYALFKEAAKENSDAMVNLGFMHMKGAGCERSTAEAQKWFEAAAEDNQMHALNSLGIFYEKGLAGEVSEDKALEYYAKAADAGHVDAMAKAGMLYRQKNNIAKAMQYLIAAAHNNNAQAQEIITYVSNADIATVKNGAFHSLPADKQKDLIVNLIDTKIKPTLAVDGGGIELINYIPGETPVVWLNYQGTCSGCHLGSTSTAQMLLEHFETMIDKNVVLYLM